MVSQLLRVMLMLLVLLAGRQWLQPNAPASSSGGVHFVELAESAGCRNVHSMVQLAGEFENIMPWLSSVGAAAAAADFDGDGDADLYVTNSGRSDGNRLFRNRGDGTFDDVTVEAGVGCGNPRGGSMHAIWGDVDNDGDLDLYVVKWGECNSLFRNDGERGGPAHFTDATGEAGVGYWGYANGATFLDYNRDGHLDILVGNYFAESIEDSRTGQWVRNDLWNPVSTRIMHETFTHADNGGRNVLYRNRGDGSFDDVTEALGLTHRGWTLAVGSGDLNNDGWPDLYLANDFGPDELYLNTGATEQPPGFRLIVDPRGHPGVGNDWWKGMNVDMGDVNNDGYLDIYVTNIFARRYKTDEGNMLWLNCADPQCPGGRGFQNVGKESGTFDGGWGWGGKFADFNNDGLLDIFTVNGFVTGDPKATYWYHVQEMVTQTKNQTADARDWPTMGPRDLSGHELGRLFIQQRHEGRGPRAEYHSGLPGARAESEQDWTPRFAEVAEQAGITDTFNGRGIALADFNLDGAIDFYVANQGAPSCYYVNQLYKTSDAAKPGFLRIKLIGRPEMPNRVGDRSLASTRDAVGARVTLHTPEGLQMRDVQGGMGFASQSEFPVHFGISDPNSVERILIQWPSGREQAWNGDQARAMINRNLLLVEGENEAHDPR
jgi:hypothetical protein